jgi:hypothetical protein
MKDVPEILDNPYVEAFLTRFPIVRFAVQSERTSERHRAGEALYGSQVLDPMGHCFKAYYGGNYKTPNKGDIMHVARMKLLPDRKSHCQTRTSRTRSIILYPFENLTCPLCCIE